MLTTPAPPLDISADFEWLRKFAASAIRLFPRRGRNLPVHISKMGGLFYWPKAVPWPVCHARDAGDLYDLSRPEKIEQLKNFLTHAYELSHLSEQINAAQREPARRWMNRQLDEVHEIERRSRSGHGVPYLPLLQLRQDQFPTLPFPRGTDLFQLLWCPQIHFTGPPGEPPGFLAFWRRQDDIGDPLLVEPPAPGGIELHECRLEAEYITEYPVSSSFEPHFRQELDQWKKGGARLYDEMLSAAPGVKLFGYPRWIAEPATPVCECKRRMTLLLTIDVGEAPAGSGVLTRWRPVEERNPEPSHGLAIGEAGALFLFHCPICRGPRLRAVVQAEQ